MKHSMKKVIVLFLAAVLALGSITAYAESAGTPPAMPDGNSAPPAMPEDSGTPPTGTPPDGAPGGAGGFGGGASTVNTGTGATTITEDAALQSETYTSSADDENALRIENGATVTATDLTVTKTGDASNSEAASFYGLDSGILALDNATLTLTGGTVTSDGSGASAVFAYGTGAKINISGTIIRTTQNNSGGIMLAGGGEINASDLDIETQGGSSAAIRTDRGGGTMNVNGGTYITNGIGSPAVYSTAAVSVANATLTANHSEGVIIEGKNSVTLTNCDVTGNMTQSNGGDSDNLQTIFIYQSMSGDADVGRSDFAMTGGSITSLSGDTFYVTNTACTIELTGVAITTADDGILMQISGNTSSRGWGQQGANGGTCDMTVSAQILEGEIVVDEISVLNLTMLNGSAFTGTINQEGDAGQVTVTLDGDSTWTLTADAHITGFGGSLDSVETNGYELYVNGVVVK